MWCFCSAVDTWCSWCFVVSAWTQTRSWSEHGPFGCGWRRSCLHRRFLPAGWKRQTWRVSREKRVTVCEIADAPSSLKIWRVEAFLVVSLVSRKEKKATKKKKERRRLADAQKIKCRHSRNMTNIYSSWNISDTAALFELFGPSWHRCCAVLMPRVLF